MPKTTIPIPDRPAAVDRFSRLSMIYELLHDLGTFGNPESYDALNLKPEIRDAVARRYDWLGDLPEGFDPDGAGDPLAEMEALHDALWPGDVEIGADNPETLEWNLANGRAHVLCARLLIRLAAHPERLQERAVEHMAQAADAIGDAQLGKVGGAVTS